MSDDRDQWKQTSGLAADSTVARIICKDPDKEEWDEEAEEKGYRSTSKYCYRLVPETRAYRKQGTTHTGHSTPTVGPLKQNLNERKTREGDITGASVVSNPEEDL